MDAAAPGTVWQTHRGEGTVTWVVADRRDNGFIYVMVVGEVAAGSVAVDYAPADGCSVATVTYELTAFAPGLPLVADVVETYEERMRIWTELLADVPADAPADVTIPNSVVA